MKGLFTIFLILSFAFLIPLNTNAAEKRSFEFNYELSVKEIPAGAKNVKIWVPFPQDSHVQKITGVKINSPVPYKMTKEKEYGNKILHISLNKPKKGITVKLSFMVERIEDIRKPHVLKVSQKSEEKINKRLLMADNLVPIDDKIKKLALDVTKGKKTDIEKVRAIYLYAVNNMTYDKSGVGWGRGDIYYACDVKKGNCTDFHSLTIGFARVLGIPARFVIGFPIPVGKSSGEISGYHCWAEFYVNGIGWIPVDASEASKEKSKTNYFFGTLCENRVSFTEGRDIVLNPKQKGSPLNYFIYPYVEVDGKPFNSLEKKFSFKDIKIKI